MNLYRPGRVLKIASFEGPMILKAVPKRFSISYPRKLRFVKIINSKFPFGLPNLSMIYHHILPLYMLTSVDTIIYVQILMKHDINMFTSMMV